MTESDTDLDLAGEFPPPDRAVWVDAVEKLLRGKPFGEVLVSYTRDHLEIQPLYTAADTTSNAVAAVLDPDRLRDGWDVRQQHSGADPQSCCRTVLADLAGGVTSVELTAPPGRWTLDSLRRATDGVPFDLVPVVLAPHADVNAARAFCTLIAEGGGAATTRSWLGLDPIGEVVRGGFANAGDVVSVAASLVPTLPSGRTLTVDSTRYADAGASDAQELAWSLSTGVAYLRLLEQIGMGPSEAAATIGFRLSAGADQFVTIASLRAARQMWARVLEASGVPADLRRQNQQAVTSRAMFSRRDPWVNILRSTTAVLAAGVAGADAITVLAFDDAIGESDGFSRRLARNTQMLLIEESHLARLIDPAGGSWFVESLTDRLAGSAWDRFQAVEAAGGIEAVIADGSLTADIDAAWRERLARLGTRRDPITGVSEFPLLEEETLDRDEREGLTGLPIRRLAAPFEDLRDAADRRLGATGVRPTVHLAALGDLATHAERSMWVTNLVAVGGVAVEGADADGSLSPLQAAARFAESESTVAVICSSDGVYAERAAATATALRESGAALVVLVGEPGERREELLAAGVDEFWHVGVDVIELLTNLHVELGL